MPTFTTPQPLSATVDVSGFELRLTAGEVDETTVEIRPHNPARSGDAELATRVSVDCSGDRLVVRSPRTARARLRSLFTSGDRVDLDITVPSGSTLEVRGWGDVTTQGDLGPVDVDIAMGDLDLDGVERLRAKTSMGDVRVRSAAGPVELRTSSGSLHVARAGADVTAKSSSGDVSVGDGAGELRLTTSSGDVRVERAGGSVRAKASSGDIRLHSVRRGTVAAESTYGRIDIGVAHGTAAWLDVEARHGVVRSELEQSGPPADTETTVEIRANAGYGDIVLRRV
jgi:DUF4097 and DUF4098 domain-containing protein YvlB